MTVKALWPPKALGVSSATELDGATVCIQTGTTTELNLADFFRSNNMSYEPVPIETGSEATAAVPCWCMRCLHNRRVSFGGQLGPSFENSRRPHGFARNHFKRAFGSSCTPWRQQLGRYCALDFERVDHSGRVWA